MEIKELTGKENLQPWEKKTIVLSDSQIICDILHMIKTSTNGRTWDYILAHFSEENRKNAYHLVLFLSSERVLTSSFSQGDNIHTWRIDL